MWHRAPVQFRQQGRLLFSKKPAQMALVCKAWVLEISAGFAQTCSVYIMALEPLRYLEFKEKCMEPI